MHVPRPRGDRRAASLGVESLVLAFDEATTRLPPSPIRAMSLAWYRTYWKRNGRCSPHPWSSAFGSEQAATTARWSDGCTAQVLTGATELGPVPKEAFQPSCRARADSTTSSERSAMASHDLTPVQVAAPAAMPLPRVRRGRALSHNRRPALCARRSRRRDFFALAKPGPRALRLVTLAYRARQPLHADAIARCGTKNCRGISISKRTSPTRS